jgi:hypothetical protein
MDHVDREIIFMSYFMRHALLHIFPRCLFIELCYVGIPVLLSLFVSVSYLFEILSQLRDFITKFVSVDMNW